MAEYNVDIMVLNSLSKRRFGFFPHSLLAGFQHQKSFPRMMSHIYQAELHGEVGNDQLGGSRRYYYLIPITWDRVATG